jgi:hypothetical protein
MGDVKTEYYLSGNEHSLNLIWCYFIRECNFDLLLLFLNI